MCFRRIVCLLFVLTLASPACKATDLQVPELLKIPTKPQENPEAKDTWWLGIVLSNDLPVYSNSTSDEKFSPSQPPLVGETVFILAKNDAPARFLVSRFDARTLSFIQHIGWVDQAWIKDDPKPYTVGAARTYLHSCWPEDSQRRSIVDRFLGVGTEAEASQNTPLKAVTHPTLGHFAAYRPIPAAKFQEWASHAAPSEGRAIQRFSFYYVAKIVVTGPDEAFAVLAIDSNLSWFDPHAMENNSGKIVGIVPLDHVALVPSRTGLVPNYSQAAVGARSSRATPLTFFKNFQQGQAAIRGQAEDAKGEKVQAVWEEVFTTEPILVPDGSYGYLVLGTQKVRNSEGREVTLYHLAVPVRMHDDSPEVIQNIVDRQLEKDRQVLLDATLSTRTVELVFVIDATGSMGPVYRPLLEAVQKYVAKLSSTEVSRPDLDRIHLKVGVVLYRDFKDSSPLTEKSDGFFDLTNATELAAFEHYMNRAAMRCRDGGDQLEQPFEGIKFAIENFCAASAPHHTQGAATMLIVMGDQGNHAKGERAKLDVADITKLATLADGQGEFSKIVFNSVFAQFEANRSPEWDSQMNALAEQTQGTATIMQFKKEALTADIPGRLASQLEKLIEDRRKESQRGRADFVANLASTVNGTPTLSLSGRRLKAQLEEIIPPKELEKIMERLGQTVFAYLFAAADESDEQPRFLPRVLLTKQEIHRLVFVCTSMSALLEEQLTKVDAQTKGGQAYNELLVRVLLSVLGDREPNEKDLVKWRGAAPSDIEHELSRLPVRFACLRQTDSEDTTEDRDDLRGPIHRTVSREDILKLVEELQRAKKALENVLENRHPITPGIGFGELHYAVQPHELP